MNMKTKITLIVLCVFIAGIAVTAVAGEQVQFKKFEDKGYKWEINEDEWNHMVKDASRSPGKGNTYRILTSKERDSDKGWNRV